MKHANALDLAAASAGLDRVEVIRRLEHAVGAAATSTWGPGRTFEARFVEERAAVDVHQLLQVVETPDDLRAQVALERVAELGFEVGDEMLVQVFYRDEDFEAARHMWETNPCLPSFDVVAEGLPAPDGPAWLRELWPVRRFGWRWGRRVELPPLREALERIERWLRRVAPPDVAAAIAPAPATELEVLRTLGPHATGLMEFYERFGRSLEGVDFLGAPVVLPMRGKQDAERMLDLAARDAAFGRWDASWIPVLSWVEEIYAVDVAEGAGERLIHWDRETAARTVVAPSFAAWLGLVAACADADILEWQNGVTCDLQMYKELQAYVLPGYPSALP
jgi:hypothetical protein